MTDDELAEIESHVAHWSWTGMIAGDHARDLIRSLVAEVRRLRGKPTDDTEPDSLRVAADQAEEKGADVAAWWLRAVAAERDQINPDKDIKSYIGWRYVDQVWRLFADRFNRLLIAGDNLPTKAIPALAAEIDRLDREVTRLRRLP
jgi:hypothetical protein